MSYGVHIKRSEAQDVHGITLEEWLTYVRSDQEVCLVGEANYKSSQGNTVQWEAPGMTEVDSPSNRTQNLVRRPHCNRSVCWKPFPRKTGQDVQSGQRARRSCPK